MKRRNFLATLFALPFAAKPLEAFTPSPGVANREELERIIAGLFDHKREIEANVEALRQNTAALLLNSPSGYKPILGRFAPDDVRAFRRALRKVEDHE